MSKPDRPARAVVGPFLAYLTFLLVWMLFFTCVPAEAHTDEELADWQTEWVDRARLGLTSDLIAEWQDMYGRHLCQLAEICPTEARHSPSGDAGGASGGSGVYRGMGSNVEQWRGLVAAYFRAEDVDRALCLMNYESGGNPDAYNPSGASGLMQVMPFWAASWGLPSSALFDPDTNLQLAAYIRDSQGWTAWSPYNRGLCR